MKKKTYIIVGLLGLSLFIGGSTYNTINIMDEGVNMSWSNLDATLQRRNDLIPNLVSTVKGYAQHEHKALTDVINARAKASKITLDENALKNPEILSQYQKSQGELSSALGRLMVVIEKYPDLKANQNFRDLQHQLEGTENRINVARQTVNRDVKEFNSYIRTFPGNIVNKAINGISKKQGFKASEQAKVAPLVDFNS